MFAERFSHKTALTIVLLVIALFSLSVLPSTAQTGTPIQFGTVVTGNLAQGSTATFTFTANAGDLVAARVIGITPGMDPNITLFGPQQETLVMNDNDLVDFPTTTAAFVFRVAVTGTYTIAVSGTPGDFLLALDALPMPPFSLIELDLPVQVTLPIPNNVQVFAFNTDPFANTTVRIDANPSDVDAFVTIRDGSGRVAASLQGNVDNACISFGPSDELHELRITVSPEAAGTIDVSLGRGPCEIGAAPETFTPTTAQIQPIAIEGVCAATSLNNMNIRSGPGTQFPVVAFWFARTPIQVVGTSQDGLWLVVQTAAFQGWIAAPLVAVVGPCDQLPVVPAPALPATTPTPGFPMMTATPMATTEGMTPTVEVTAPVDTTPVTTPGITPTVATPEVTPTVEVTPEVTQATG